MRPVMVVVGTRPEGIKMMPLYFALKQANIPTILCATSQHSTLLSDIFSVFGVSPDLDLKIMKHNQDLFHVTTTVLHEMQNIYKNYQPSLVCVQGDTTTVMAAGMAAFYSRIPVAHIEAGLRTGDFDSPYPEEFNRTSLGLITTYHFAPTAQAVGNLLGEGKKRENVFYVGNTVVDALRIIENKIINKELIIDCLIENFFKNAHEYGHNTLLFTMHRRESFGYGLYVILQALKDFALTHPNVVILYPYHPNPDVLEIIKKINLSSVVNIILVEPLSYKDLAYVLLNIDIVATDSGGIQEEAVSLGKHVLVLREKSERMEGVWEGLASIIGFNAEKFTVELEKILNNLSLVFVRKNIYGDGFASEKIVKIIQNRCMDFQEDSSSLMNNVRHVHEEMR